MNPFKNASTSLAAFTQRVQGLLNDGYWVTFRVEEKDFIFCKLTHRNGNRISVQLNRRNGELSQITNNKQVFTSSVCEH